jgi:hypothetical protein
VADFQVNEEIKRTLKRKLEVNTGQEKVKLIIHNLPFTSGVMNANKLGRYEYQRC